VVSSQDIHTLERLRAFYDLLKKYRTQLDLETQTNRAKQELDQLREELVSQSGPLRQEIERLTGKRWITGGLFGLYRGSRDIWDEALSSPPHYEALRLAIDATNQAIGILQTVTPTKSVRQYQLTSLVYWGEIFYQKALRRLWAWIKSHRLISIICSSVMLLAAVVTLWEFFLG
jgi:hypothetical protein